MDKHKLKQWLLALTGIELEHVSHRERLVSALGGFLGIFAIIVVSLQFIPLHSAALVVASMGASAVLVFGVPHGKLSQPWSLIGGHVLSAFIGVTCARYIDNTSLAAAIAVGAAIGVMHYTRCIHPPGGASALAAVVSGSAVHDLGYQFVLTPVLLNTLVIFAVAVIFNALWPWRLYPAGLMGLREQAKLGDTTNLSSKPDIQSNDIHFALAKMDLLVDVTDDDLARIYQLARQHASENHVPVDAITLGHYYCNGEYGEAWSVRRVIDESIQGKDDKIIFRTVAGKDRRQTAVSSREEFARWARYEVYLNENSWQRVTETNPQ